ncbi:MULTISPECIES: NAD(P)H-binding protein [Oenococcus]|uniref:Rrf2-linked NADH-flavin reductase n=1 Tax=Oenococcus kitaharae DSM 17330 TaxID=1045004 RepID=G9WIC5_9LACO|nr:NAD(P)H-binding protein [Oenococcus kitaharae]EHN58937.1 Rrf2-linked NADH-flavin reductase [Oenococcus kitaharae DSM 17330]OEY81748.1 Rrf2 family transcriptional regulator [Oenococcus kitaharae]OEY83979.1 Rrf2 family transcriptional regulator [Oenococcus kitaharae]OEY85665.1 Rrf2 family transcriptional regulator [Oenococcus kitaharae]
MKIAIIGATGMAGRSIYREAAGRGHEVTAFVRDLNKAEGLLGPGRFIKKSLYQIGAANLHSYDVVINAFANHTHPIENFDALSYLLRIGRKIDSRFIFILGAASLKREDGQLLYDSLSKLANNEAWIDEPKFGVDALYVLQHDAQNVNWTAISPQQEFVDGPASDYRTGRDELIYAEDGKSHVTTGNIARAILNEIEEPRFIGERFTVADK